MMTGRGPRFGKLMLCRCFDFAAYAFQLTAVRREMNFIFLKASFKNVERNRFLYYMEKRDALLLFYPLTCIKEIKNKVHKTTCIIFASSINYQRPE